MELSFWKGRRVFVTGHTGFKGSWLCRVLVGAGAEVTGFALPPPDGPSLFVASGVEGHIRSVLGDVRDADALSAAYRDAAPQLVFHLAAQPLVRESYQSPAATYATNVMGTVNLLECVRGAAQPASVVNVTTDKVYRNNEWPWGYRETDVLDGYEPYANSKSCSELVSTSYRRSFFEGTGVVLSTARAGNVIGGGDFATDRILPDCYRAAAARRPITVRNPNSVRPYQHVLEPLFAYLLLAQKQQEDPSLSGAYNIGPADEDCITTGQLAGLFCQKWGADQSWHCPEAQPGAPHEAGLLRLDCALARRRLGWAPRWRVDTALDKTVEWYKAFEAGGDLPVLMDTQIDEYINAGGQSDV